MFKRKTNQQSTSNQLGFTLVEMMVTIGIVSILMAISINAWASMRENARAQSTAEEIFSALSAARLKALSTRTNQQVTFNFATENVTSPLWPASSRTYKNINLIAYNYSACTVQSNTANNTITFQSTGQTTTTAGANSAILIQPANAATPIYYLIVSNVTGKIRMARACP